MAVAKQERVVSYFYDEEIGNYCYGGGNPMRPHRARLVYSLLKNYGLTKTMSIHRPEPRSFDELTEFHADDYIDFLKTVTPSNAEEHMNQLKRFNMGQIGDVDCPVFDGVYEYCQMYSGGSVNGAAQLAAGQADVAFNWSGGMHHAKKAEASGFCYVNDIVLGILELLKVYARVLYVDIDIHHGDGVEEAFYLTDRVMTVSFHKYGEFFPGTGALADIGYGKGKHYTVNVPLKDGMDDDNYQMMFEPIMSKVMEMYQPCAIVMCCGADSLSGDKLGCFNLSIEGHSHCIEFLAKYNVPTLVLGGGGYTLRNVARCWCFETGRIMGVDLPDQIPDKALNEFNYYLDTGSLRISVSNMKNMNTREELLEIQRKVLEHLAQLPPVPSAQMAYRPPIKKQADLPEEDADVRGGGQLHDERRRGRFDSDDEEEGEGRMARGASGDAPTRRTPPASPAPHASGPTSVPVKKETSGSLPPDMEAATLATSEALQGSGSGGGAAGGARTRGTPPPAGGSNGGAAGEGGDGSNGGTPAGGGGGGGAMDVDTGSGGAGARAGTEGCVDGSVGGSGRGGAVVGAAAIVGARGGSNGGVMSGGGEGGGAGVGAPPAISMLGPSTGLSALGVSTGGGQAPMKAELSPSAAGAASRPNIIGASWTREDYESLANAGVGSPRNNTGTSEGGGGIYRPQ